MSDKELPTGLPPQNVVMELLNRANITDPQMMLELTQRLRVETLKTLMSNSGLMIADSKLTSNVRQFIADLDKQTLTQQKLQLEREANEASNENILAVFAELTRQHGRNFTINSDGSTTAATPTRPANLDSIQLPTSEFDIEPGEMIIGNDTEESL